MRHRDALVKVGNNIERALLLKEKGEPIEFIAFELREGLIISLKSPAKPAVKIF